MTKKKLVGSRISSFSIRQFIIFILVNDRILRLIFLTPRLLASSPARELFLRLIVLKYHNVQPRIKSRVHKDFRNFLDKCLMFDQELIIKYREFACWSPSSEIERYQNIYLVEKNRRYKMSPHVCILREESFSKASLVAFLETLIKSRIIENKQEPILFIVRDSKNYKSPNPALFYYFSKYLDIMDEELFMSKHGENLGVTSSKEVSVDITLAIEIENRAVYIEFARSIINKKWSELGFRPLFELSDRHLDIGNDYLRRCGMSDNDWFVTIHVRDSGDKTGSWMNEDKMFKNRNADIETYSDAIDAVISSGGWVIRVGDSRMKPIKPRPKLIEYCFSDEKSRELELYLFTRCRFFIGTASGPILIPAIFNTPVVATNFSSIGVCYWSTNSITISKRLVDNQGNYYSLIDALKSKVVTAETFFDFEESGIGFVDNSENEITDAVIEMLDILNNTSRYSEINVDLNDKAKDLYQQFSGYAPLGRFGRAYLSNLHAQELI